MGDLDAFRNLYEFRDICMSQFGSMPTAFDFGLDKNGSGACDYQELQDFCTTHGFTGNVPLLFSALDVNLHRIITRDNLDFLQNWEGERFSNGNRQFDFGVARL